ncbi:UNVERIFIED_CONTAM: hypothetical protein GTU68_046782 [Idotea baltica]|nr:hypothetical protein [Idotea baltica]
MSDRRNLFNKVWDLHAVRTLPNQQTQLFIGLHLIHEVTSPQAFEILRERNLKVAYPKQTVATVDHIVPTADQSRPFQDGLAEQMMSAIEKNCDEFGVTLMDLNDGRQGIVHVVGPEQGLTQPGMTIVCGDSHTSTHGAFGSIAIGIGTSNVAQVLATQIVFNAADIEPTVTWGITPAQSVGISQPLPRVAECDASERVLLQEALDFMSLQEGEPVQGTKIDVAFIGSCTNGRISDLREAARIAEGHHVADGVKAIVVPGSQLVRQQAIEEGLHKIFKEAGFEWRAAGCSMCLAMNPDKLQGREVCASSSNRNFKGRQGSPTGRTLLMSPAMVAAAAIEGSVTDIRQFAGAAV